MAAMYHTSEDSELNVRTFRALNVSYISRALFENIQALFSVVVRREKDNQKSLGN